MKRVVINITVTLFIIVALFIIFTNDCKAGLAEALSGRFKVTGKKTTCNSLRLENAEDLVTQSVMISVEESSDNNMSLTAIDATYQHQADALLYHSISSYSVPQTGTLTVSYEKNEHVNQFVFLKLLTWLIKFTLEELVEDKVKTTKVINAGKKKYSIRNACQDKEFKEPVYQISFYDEINRMFTSTIYMTPDGRKIVKLVISRIGAGLTTYTLEREEPEDNLLQQQEIEVKTESDDSEEFLTPPSSPINSSRTVLMHPSLQLIQVQPRGWLHK